jgi:hypothetical protein
MTKALRDSGKMEMVTSLGMPGEAKCIHPTDAGPVVTDGAYVKTNEPLGALFILEAADMAEAVQLASLHPSAQLGRYFGGGIEVRTLAYH